MEQWNIELRKHDQTVEVPNVRTVRICGLCKIEKFGFARPVWGARVYVIVMGWAPTPNSRGDLAGESPFERFVLYGAELVDCVDVAPGVTELVFEAESTDGTNSPLLSTMLQSRSNAR